MITYTLFDDTKSFIYYGELKNPPKKSLVFVPDV